MHKRSGRGIWIILVLVFILFNSALFILVTAQPKFEFSLQEQDDGKTVQISVLRTSFFPFKNFTVLLDDAPLELTKVSDKIYSTVVDKNGTIEIRAVNFNGMSRNAYDHVGGIDDAPPNVYGEVTRRGVVTVTFEDPQSGINYDAIYAIPNDSEQHIVPTSIDQEKSTVVFEYEGGTLEVHIFDTIGNEAIATFDDTADLNRTEEETEEESETSTSAKTKASSQNSAKETTKAKSTTAKSSSSAESSKAKASSEESTKAKSSSSAESSKSKTSSAAESSKAKVSSAAESSKASQGSSASASSTAETTKVKSSQSPESSKAKPSESSMPAASKSETTKASKSKTTSAAQKSSEVSSAAPTAETVPEFDPPEQLPSADTNGPGAN